MRWCRGDIRRQIEFFDPSVTIAPRALINPPFRGGSCPKSVTHVSLLICYPCPPTIPDLMVRGGTMRKTIQILLLLGLFYFGASETFAQCSCVAERRDITPHKEFKLADAVFIGKVIEIKNTARD